MDHPHITLASPSFLFQGGAPHCSLTLPRLLARSLCCTETQVSAQVQQKTVILNKLKDLGIQVRSFPSHLVPSLTRVV